MDDFEGVDRRRTMHAACVGVFVCVGQGGPILRVLVPQLVGAAEGVPLSGEDGGSLPSERRRGWSDGGPPSTTELSCGAAAVSPRPALAERRTGEPFSVAWGNQGRQPKHQGCVR